MTRPEDRYLVDVRRGTLAWTAGDAATALAAFDSVLAYQSDNPEGLQGRAAALALAGRIEEAVAAYDRAVRMRTGVVELRCAYARDLLRVGRTAAARVQLAEARLIDEENPTAEALRAWADLLGGDLDAARAHARQALAWGPWCDLAGIVTGGIERRAGDGAAATATWAGIVRRMAAHTPPEYVYRPKLAVWEETHTLPEAERLILESLRRH
jgi:tetratricopeptide (TPR) repeat protein